MIDYSDYGAKLATPQEIAAIEKKPLRQVLDELRGESGTEYHAAFANTLVYLKAQLLTRIHGDANSIKLLKNLEEIQKAAKILDNIEEREVSEHQELANSLSAIFQKLGVSDLDGALFAIDMLLQRK